MAGAVGIMRATQAAILGQVLTHAQRIEEIGTRVEMVTHCREKARAYPIDTRSAWSRL